jgi:hypothetical protein
MQTPAHRDSTTPTPAIARRDFLRAGAWAAPVVLVAAAVPAASASPVTLRGNVLIANGTGEASSYDGRIGWSATLQFNPSDWGAESPTASTILTASWVVEAISNSTGAITTIATDTQPFALYQSRYQYDEAGGFTVGDTYTVRFRTTSLIVTPNPQAINSDEVTYVANPVEVETSIVVNAAAGAPPEPDPAQ